MEISDGVPLFFKKNHPILLNPPSLLEKFEPPYLGKFGKVKLPLYKGGGVPTMCVCVVCVYTYFICLKTIRIEKMKMKKPHHSPPPKIFIFSHLDLRFPR